MSTKISLRFRVIPDLMDDHLHPENGLYEQFVHERLQFSNDLHYKLVNSYFLSYGFIG